jgi:hypothetical protein
MHFDFGVFWLLPDALSQKDAPALDEILDKLGRIAAYRALLSTGIDNIAES